MSATALPVAGLLVGGWALLPPYSGPALNTAMRVEVADHVVPGLIVILLSAGALVMTRGERVPPSGALLVAGAVVLLAGLWMTATHVPLVLQAIRDEAPAGAVAYHSLPASPSPCSGPSGSARAGRSLTGLRAAIAHRSTPSCSARTT